MNFQDLFSQLNKVMIFLGIVYSLKIKPFFQGKVMYVQYGFLYLILTRHKFTEWIFIYDTDQAQIYSVPS
jgi:hypothetical protein